jgi:hypothetical protein
MRKFFTAAVMCGTMLAPLASTAAYADTIPPVTANPADDTTLAAMETQCDTLAAAHGTLNGDRWTGEVALGAITYVSGPTEVGDHGIADAISGTLHGAGTFTPAHLEIRGDPYRNGGSVNMFGMQQSVGGRYSASTYDYQADFVSRYSHAFTCNIFREVYHPEVTTHHPAVGIYVVNGDFGGSEAAIRGNCAAFTNQGPDVEWWGEPFHGGNDDKPHCRFEGTPAGDTTVDEYWDPALLAGNEAGVTINQDQTDTLVAHEDAGEGYDVSDTLLIGQVVVCISPTSGTQVKKGAPGTWRQQNGYTGDKCTTVWYNGGATVGVPNLNTGSNNWVTVPIA